jgi:hypothetical protein
MTTAFGPVRVLDGGSLAAGRGVLDRGVDQLEASASGRGSREHERAVRSDAGPGRLGDGVGLGDHQRGRREVAAQRRRLAQHVDADGEDLERPGVARELHPAGGDARQVS